MDSLAQAILLCAVTIFIKYFGTQGLELIIATNLDKVKHQ